MTERPILLDLFCKAGGAAMGYHLAGFDVVGVDIEPQPNYPFPFVQADALGILADRIGIARRRFAAVHASPPCQAFSSMRTMPDARAHPDLIGQTRALLRWVGLPYVIENVVGAPLANATLLCGTMFGLGAAGADLRRHRLFEASFPLSAPGPCRHGGAPTIGVYGGHVRNRRRREGSKDRGVTDYPQAAGNEAMGIDWMTLAELSEAIPPAYTRHVGAALMAELRGSARP